VIGARVQTVRGAGLTSYRTSNWKAAIDKLRDRWEEGDDTHMAGLPAGTMQGGGPLLAKLELPTQPESLDIEPHLQTALACICDGNVVVVPLASLAPDTAAAALAYVHAGGLTGSELEGDATDDEQDADGAGGNPERNDSDDSEAEEESESATAAAASAAGGSDSTADDAGDASYDYDEDPSVDRYRSAVFGCIADNGCARLPGTQVQGRIHTQWTGLPEGVRWRGVEWRGVGHGCGSLLLLRGTYLEQPDLTEMAVLDVESGECLVRSMPRTGISSCCWAPAGRRSRSQNWRGADLGGGVLVGTTGGHLELWACGEEMRAARTAVLFQHESTTVPVESREEFPRLITVAGPDEGSMHTINGRRFYSSIWTGFLSEGHELAFVRRAFRRNPARARRSPIVLGWRPVANGPLHGKGPGALPAPGDDMTADSGGNLAVGILSLEDDGFDRAPAGVASKSRIEKALATAEGVMSVESGKLDDDDALSRPVPPAARGGGLSGHLDDAAGLGFTDYTEWRLTMLGEVVTPTDVALRSREEARFVISAVEETGHVLVGHTAADRIAVLTPWHASSRSTDLSKAAMFQGAWAAHDVKSGLSTPSDDIHDPQTTGNQSGGVAMVTGIAVACADQAPMDTAPLLDARLPPLAPYATVFLSGTMGVVDSLALIDPRRRPANADEAKAFDAMQMSAPPIRPRQQLRAFVDAAEASPTSEDWFHDLTPGAPPPTVGRSFPWATSSIGRSAPKVAFFDRARSWQLAWKFAGRHPSWVPSQVRFDRASLDPAGASVWAYADLRLVCADAHRWRHLVADDCTVLPSGAQQSRTRSPTRSASEGPDATASPAQHGMPSLPPDPALAGGLPEPAVGAQPHPFGAAVAPATDASAAGAFSPAPTAVANAFSQPRGAGTGVFPPSPTAGANAFLPAADTTATTAVSSPPATGANAFWPAADSAAAAANAAVSMNFSSFAFESSCMRLSIASTISMDAMATYA
jgi:hypothetical protein